MPMIASPGHLSVGPISQYAFALVSEAPSLVLEILLSTGRLLGELSLHDAADL